MRKVATVIAFGFFMLGFNANALTKGEKMKCTGQLHACFQGDYSSLVDADPRSQDQCVEACTGSFAHINENGGCSAAACVSRCEVAFELTTTMCE